MKLKKLQLIIVLLFILTILIMIIGLILIHCSNFHDYFNNKWKYCNGFKMLNHYGLSYFIDHSTNYLCSICNNYENYYELIKLQIGIIFLYNSNSNFNIYNYVVNLFNYWVKNKFKK